MTWLRSLERLPIGQRIIIAIVMITAVLIALFIISRILGYGGAEAQGQVLAPSQFDARIAELEHEAIDNAFRDKVEHLFAVWLQDSTGQPQRATAGITAARKAYIGAMTEIQKRERRLPQPRPQEAPR
jgi:hypothetical protein